MKRIFTFLLALVFMFSCLSFAGCSEETLPEETTPDETTGSPEPEYDPEHPYTICGNDLHDYTLLVYLPEKGFDHDAAAQFIAEIEEMFVSAFGFAPEYRRAKNKADLYDPPLFDHEIIFTIETHRKDIPKNDGFNAIYGITEKGTLYFAGATTSLYQYLLNLFFEEYLHIPAGSGQKCEGCRLEPFARQLEPLSDSYLEQNGYKEVFSDTFDGDSLNYDVWDLREHGRSRCGYLSDSQVKVADGLLTITGERREDGEFGEGWYAASIAPKQWYNRGFFEARIQANHTFGYSDFWSAFWIQGHAPYTPEKSLGGTGEGGCEIDIFEFLGFEQQINFYCSGGKDVTSTELDAEHFTVADNKTSYDEDFHTHALLWDEQYYRVYIDGMLVVCTDFMLGTSNAEEQAILSVCIPDEMREERLEEPATMKVDSFRIWQKN